MALTGRCFIAVDNSRSPTPSGSMKNHGDFCVQSFSGKFLFLPSYPFRYHALPLLSGARNSQRTTRCPQSGEPDLQHVERFLQSGASNFLRVAPCLPSGSLLFRSVERCLLSGEPNSPIATRFPLSGASSF